MIDPHPLPEAKYRTPSRYGRCRRPPCRQSPVADVNRGPHPNTGRDQWWAYCADHLAEYNKEVRDGQVWWKGKPAATP